MRTTLTISDVIQEWLNSLDVLPVSRSGYKYKISMWFRFLSSNKKNVRTPSNADVLSYKDYLRSINKSEYTVKSYITVVKLFYSFCEKRKYWDNIAIGIKCTIRNRFRNKLPLTAEQASMLLNSIPTDTVMDKRDKLIVSLMLLNGLRVCEVSRINICDFETYNNVPVLYVQRKGRLDKSQSVALHSSIAALYEDYITEREFDVTDPLFISHRYCDRFKVIRLTSDAIARMVKKRLLAVGIKDKRISAHSLRHTFGTLLIERNVDIDAVKDLMGHSSTDITRIYVEMAQRRKVLLHSPAFALANELIKMNNK